jgi:hypothetical protein
MALPWAKGGQMGRQQVRCARHDTAQRSEFRIVEVDDELVPAVRKGAFVEGDGYWYRSFPAGTPHLDQAWGNFERLIEPWLRQGVGLDPVPWVQALELVCARLTGDGVDWWLTGSGALSVRGVALVPGDLDLVVSGQDSGRVGELLLDGLVEPVAPAGWFCDWWGRAVLGARVEWVGGIGPAADQPQVSDFGLVAAANLEVVRWRGWDVRVPPVVMQREVSLRRGLPERVRLIDDWAGGAVGQPGAGRAAI